MESYIVKLYVVLGIRRKTQRIISIFIIIHLLVYYPPTSPLHSSPRQPPLPLHHRKNISTHAMVAAEFLLL